MSHLRLFFNSRRELGSLPPSSHCSHLLTGSREQFDSLSERERCRLLSLLSDLCCAADSTLAVYPSTGSSSKSLRCTLCGPLQGASAQPNCVDPQLKKTTAALFSHLACLPGFVDSPTIRVFGMSILRRLAIHATDEALLDLEASTPAQWCLQSLQSSVRELRVAARYPHFSCIMFLDGED